MDVALTLSGSAVAAFAGGFDLLWGTGDCGNDAVFGTVGTSPTSDVPEPGMLAVVTASVPGILALRLNSAKMQT